MTYEQVEKFISKRLEGVRQGKALNQYNSKPLKLAPTPENAKKFNEIYRYLVKSDLNILERAPGGSIRKGPRYMNNMYAWDLRKSSLGVMLTISLGGKLYVLKFGLYKQDEAPEIYPTQAFKEFSDKCLEHGIVLEDYAIDNGPEVRATTEQAPIDMWFIHTEEDPGLENVHHLDFHSSYPAGLANTHPEFRPVMEYFFDKRHDDPAAKFLMNSGIGFMCTEKFGFKAKYAHLRKDAVEDNNRRIEELQFKLLSSGRTIVGRNTDGIWYKGEIYHGTGEGKGLGQWENDHTNCKFRAKSDGAYEFIEDGKYYAVQRGQTTLDAIKPRDEWIWGDIFKTSIIGWKFDNKEGIYFNEIQTQ